MAATSDNSAAGLASSSFQFSSLLVDNTGPGRFKRASSSSPISNLPKINLNTGHCAGNNVTSNLKWDLGGRNVILGLLKVLKSSDGRFLELGASYSDKTQLLTVEAAGKPHKEHKLAAA